MRSRILLLLLAGLLLCPVVRAGDDWKDALKESLKAKYELTKFGGDRLRITQPGTVVVSQKDGIIADLATDFTFTVNKVSAGQVGQASGFAAVVQNKKTSRVFKSGERAYVTKIDVKDNEVHYVLMSCDTYDVNVHGSTKQTRYMSFLNFQFPNNYLASADADAVKKDVDVVFAPETEVKAASTKNVELGQSPEQVEAALGRPDKIVSLGSKKVYVYKDMKIVFMDSKVADVQ